MSEETKPLEGHAEGDCYCANETIHPSITYKDEYPEENKFNGKLLNGEEDHPATNKNERKLFAMFTQSPMSELSHRALDMAHDVKDELNNAPMEDDSDSDSTGNELNVADLFKCPSCLLIYADPDGLAEHMDVHEEKIEVKKSSSLQGSLKKPKMEQQITPRPALKVKMPALTPCFVVLDRCDDLMTSTSYPETAKEMPSTRKIAKNLKNIYFSIKTSLTSSNSERRTRSRTALYTCTICSKTFFLPYHFQQHLLTHESRPKDKSLKYPSFPKIFARSDHHRAHCKTHNGKRKRNYNCQKCTERFISKLSLEGHMLLQHWEEDQDHAMKPFKDATIKVENIPSYTNLQTESKVVLNVEDFLKKYSEVPILPQCWVALTRCDQPILVDTKPALSNMSSDKYQTPIKLEQGPQISRKAKPVRCPICFKDFHHRTHLKFHSFTHSKERNYKCPLCPKAFTQPGNVNLHIRTHTREKPYKCQQCSKGFTQLSQLQHHIPTHNLDKDKPHKCPICSKGFSQLFNLKAHMNIHSGKTPYKCEICPQAFRHPGPLQTHIRGHSGERRYRCLRCPKAFAYPGLLKIHVRSHTGDRPYGCLKCSKRFTNSTSLKQHLVRVHD